jgi:ABC-type sugar transport system permease subunit
MDKAMDMLRQISSRFGWQSVFEVLQSYAPALSLMFIALVIHWMPVRWKEFYRGTFIRIPLVAKVIVVVVVAMVIFQVKSADLQPFIYFRF